MNLEQLARIRLHCELFRDAVDRCAPELTSDDYTEWRVSDFLAEMLGTYLREHLGVECEFVGGRLNGKGHAWLELGSLVIDITADRLAPESRPIVIEEDPEFYRKFEIRTREEPDFDKYQREETRERLVRDYKLLVADVRHHQGPS